VKVKNSIGSLSNSRVPISSTPGIFSGRVKKIILDDKTYSDLFKQYGEWASIGYIIFDILNQPTNDENIDNLLVAKPLFPNQKVYPLENEIVSILLLPDSNTEANVNSKTYYYFQPINIWNNNHHNAIPDPITAPVPESKRDYQQTQAGAVRKVTDGSTDIILGKTFEEKLNIKTLQPFEGDHILEGRWGNSIRFSSTVKNSNINNSWSTSGNNGDPITILRNGQYEDDKDPWIPQVENINKDISSFYLTSTQIIPLTPSAESYNSYKSSPPEKINKYKQSQIILNSGRLVLNSYEDHLLLSAKKSINLNSVDSVNLDTKTIILQSNKLYLGNKNATEPILLGNKTVNLLTELFQNMTAFMTICSSLVSTVPGTPLVPLNAVGGQMVSTLQKLTSQLQTLKSKDNFTI
jgi:hypothetical protein